MSPQAARTRPRHRRRLHPVAVSLLLIAACAFVVFYAFNQGLPFVRHFTLHAVVSNSVNVRQDSPVRVAGIDVGAVTGTEPRGRATEISFTLNDQGLPIHTDATVRIRDRLFLEGGYYLELDPGTPGAPLARDGFTIPLANTIAPVQFYNVLSTFNAAARSSIEHLLATLNQGFSPIPGHPQSDSGAGGLKTAIPQMAPVLKDVAWVSRGLRGEQPGDVQTLLHSVGDVSGTLARNEASLVALVHDLNVTSGALAAADGAVGATVSGLDQTVRTAPPSLASIDRALPPLVQLGGALDPSLKVAPPILTGMTQTVRQLAQAVSPAERGPLIRSLSATFTQFPGILHQLASVFPTTKVVTDCLSSHVIPLLNKTVPDGSLSTGLPLWQDFVHFLPSLTGASGSFDANGPYTRVVAGAGTNTVSSPLLGSIPLLGQLVGSTPAGGSGGSLQGARPQWVGDLTPADFRPDVSCSTQPLASLASPTAAPDMVAKGRP